jgi:hypothetical protein
MRIQVDLSTLAQTQWHDYAVRFLFGGLITTLAGIIAKEFGPGIGGLFLAFPAIFPASATLIEKHEKEKKESLGLKGEARGRIAASIDAAGSSMESIGLVVFALVVSNHGHSCCWCQVQGNELTLLPYPLSHQPVRYLKLPREAFVIGRVTNSWLPPDQPSGGQL